MALGSFDKSYAVGEHSARQPCHEIAQKSRLARSEDFEQYKDLITKLYDGQDWDLKKVIQIHGRQAQYPGYVRACQQLELVPRWPADL